MEAVCAACKGTIMIQEETNFTMIPKDPIMLLSFLNLKLRDFYDSLDALCDDLDVDRSEVEEKLASINYVYSRERNQFV